MMQLEEFVFQIEQTENAGTARIKWRTISQQLNRTAKECQKKWKTIHIRKLNKRPITTEEDAIILQRVAEWDDRRIGLWTSLERELGKSADRIKMRWQKTLSYRKI